MAYDVVGYADALDLLATSLNEEINFVEGFIDELYSRIAAASSYWEGESYVSFAEMLGSYTNYFYNYLDLIKSYYNAIHDTTMPTEEKFEADVSKAVSLSD